MGPLSQHLIAIPVNSIKGDATIKAITEITMSIKRLATCCSTFITPLLLVRNGVSKRLISSALLVNISEILGVK